MRTRFTPLVKMKKDLMDKRERELQKANSDLQKAQTALDTAYSDLKTAQTPSSGSIKELQMAQTIITSQRTVIKQKQEWADYAASQVNQAQHHFKEAMIEFEKFKYLEAEELKVIMQAQKKQQQIQMDEVAMQTFARKEVF